MNMTNEESYEKTIERYRKTDGPELNLRMLAEEASEVTQASLKLIRCMTHDASVSVKEKDAVLNVLEEIADFIICKDQVVGDILEKYPDANDIIKSIIAYKLDRKQRRFDGKPDLPKPWKQEKENRKNVHWTKDGWRLIGATVRLLSTGTVHTIVDVIEEPGDQPNSKEYKYKLNNGLICVNRELHTMEYGKHKTKVISAFPCCGKTYTYRHMNSKDCTILDSDSSQFSWIQKLDGTKVRNENFPQNYIDYIKGNYGVVDVIFVSSHLDVRQGLTDAKIPFITVYPEEDMLDEWIGRMCRRGDDKKFIDFQISHWKDFVSDEIVKHEPVGSNFFRLGHDEYIDLNVLLDLI